MEPTGVPWNHCELVGTEKDLIEIYGTLQNPHRTILHFVDPRRLP